MAPILFFTRQGHSPALHGRTRLKRTVNQVRQVEQTTRKAAQKR